MDQHQFKLSPKHWRIAMGQPIANMLDRVVFHAGFADQVQVVSLPDGETYIIKVCKLDPSGEILYKGSNKKGFDFFKVEIKSPNGFYFSSLGSKGKRFLQKFKSAEALEKEAQALLENTLCVLWSESMKSRE